MNLIADQVLHHRGSIVVRRQRLAPGEATPWHRDPFHRVTVVLSGDLLSIEFRDGGETLTWQVTAGEVDWVDCSRFLLIDVVFRFQSFEHWLEEWLVRFGRAADRHRHFFGGRLEIPCVR
jgi:hypothetical protein